MASSASLIKNAYQGLVNIQNHLQSLFLLAIRLIWGFQFLKTGMGKWKNIEHVVRFFQDLQIPLPALNAYCVATLECVGGVLLILGLGSRLITIPLAFSMVVAYLTADLEAARALWSDPSAFAKAAPFPFLLTSLIVMLFGAGFFSLDRLLGSFFKNRNQS